MPEIYLQNFVTSRPNHAEGVYGIKAKPCMESTTCCGMESSRNDAWHQSEGRYTLKRDAIRLRRLHTRLRRDYIPILRIG